MNKRDKVLSLLDAGQTPASIPAAFFIHFPPQYHRGQEAIDKHLEYFRATDMDIVKIREQYGTRLAFYGGIDKHVIRRSKAEIVDELEYKIPPMVASGGCVLALDHRIPNGTPLENYRFYIQKAWEIMARETAKL